MLAAQEALDTQLKALLSAQENPFLEDSLVCMSCFQLANDCACHPKEKIFWTLTAAIEWLRLVLTDAQGTGIASTTGLGQDDNDAG